MAYATDNRWISGQAPDDAIAAYGARWIDQGDFLPFDIVPDRQGFAYSDGMDRDRLILFLQAHTPHQLPNVERGDHWQQVVLVGGFQCWLRRTGGYVYCEAWLEAS